MAILDVRCPGCAGLNVIKHGKLLNGEQRYCCCAIDCDWNIFILNYRVVGRTPEAKVKIRDMVMKGSGVRDTAEDINVSQTTVIEVLKKRTFHRQGEPNPAFSEQSIRTICNH